MNLAEEEAQLRRAEILAKARSLASDWAYWCIRTNVRTGYEPFMNTGGIERRFRFRRMEEPEPKMPEANEVVGLDVQRAFIHLPSLYRRTLRAEFCVKPWIYGLDEGETKVAVSRKARVSVGAYEVTVTRALLSLANVMKRMGTWKD